MDNAESATTSVVADEEIIGVVHASSSGGGKAQGETNWTLRFRFEPWRQVGGAVVDTRLNVAKSVSDEELKELMDLIKPYTIWRARVRIDDRGDRATLIDLVGRETSDDELTRRSEELQKPVIVEDPYFGQFTLKRAFNDLEIKADWQGTTVPLTLSLDGCDDQQALIRSAQSFWENQDSWDRRNREYAAEELLELKNDSWQDEDAEELSADDFKGKMKPESVSLSPDGSYEIFYDDGDLFWGHVIIVSGTLEDGPDDAQIAG